jgi:hypothetical protein
MIRGGKGTVVLILAGVIVGWLTFQPAIGHLGTPRHLWIEHIRPKADARYLRNTKVFVSVPFTLGALADDTVTKLCPAGWQALGGGVDFEVANADVQVISSAPLLGSGNLFAADQGRNPAAAGWRVTVHNNGLAVDGVVGVVCAR